MNFQSRRTALRTGPMPRRAVPAAVRPQGEGEIQVQVFAAGQSVPLEDATVTIENTDALGQASIYRVLVTDMSGETEAVPYPAPGAQLSQQPGAVQPYATCSIQVDCEGYYVARYEGVQVFADTLNLQQAQLIPLPQSEEGEEILREYPIPPHSLGLSEEVK